MSNLLQSIPRKAYSRMLDLLPDRMRGSVDYHLGHHSHFYPLGGPMNGQAARLEIVRTLIVELRPALLVEIGTFRGTTTEWLAQFGPQVITVETSPRFYRFSELRLGGRKNVRLMPGNPMDALGQLAVESAFADGTTLFYFDSRNLTHPPLREELEFIFSKCPSCVVVVDDFQVEGDIAYGFADFGPDKALTMDYLRACAVPDLAVFFPAAPGQRETGQRRGSVFLTASPHVMRVMEAMPSLLRPWHLLKDASPVYQTSVTPSHRRSTTPKPKLDDVTLCCIDCAQPALAIKALQASREQCDFAASLLITHAEVAPEGIEVRRIPPITNIWAYSDFVLSQLVEHITTPFVLLIQWDGFVLDGACWDDRFRQFDYIGAPWTTGRLKGMVGNGGFSLRSRRLLSVLPDMSVPPSRLIEDILICNIWRPALEGRGIRIADVATARRFSVEHDTSEEPTFGFHGIFNLWRAVPADALESVLRGMSPGAAGSSPARHLILEYVRLRRWVEANAALTNYERQLGTAKTIEALSAITWPGVGQVLYDAVRSYGLREGSERQNLDLAVEPLNQ